MASTPYVARLERPVRGVKEVFVRTRAMTFIVLFVTVVGVSLSGELDPEDLRFAPGTKSVLDWSPVPGAEAYGIDSHTIPNFGSNDCAATGIAETTFVFEPTPAPGQALGISISGQRRNPSNGEFATSGSCPWVVFVDPHATGLNSGMNWRDAYTSVETALLAAIDGSPYDPYDPVEFNVEFWISGPIVESVEVQPAFPRRPTLSLSLLGGFSGWEWSVSQRAPVYGPTSWSGGLSFSQNQVRILLDGFNFEVGSRITTRGTGDGQTPRLEVRRCSLFSTEVSVLTEDHAAPLAVTRSTLLDSNVSVNAYTPVDDTMFGDHRLQITRNHFVRSTLHVNMSVWATGGGMNGLYLVDIQQNRFEDSPVPISFRSDLNEGGHDYLEVAGKIASNVFVNAAEAAIQSWNFLQHFGSVVPPREVIFDPEIINNTALGCARFLRLQVESRPNWLWGYDPNSRNRCQPRLINNIIDNATVAGIDERPDDETIGESTDPISLNNVFWRSPVLLIDEGTTPIDNVGDLNDIAECSANSIFDPLFTNASTGDIHLLPDSPAIDRGLECPVDGMDIDGRSRVVDGDGDGNATCDLGADEYEPAQ